MRPPKRPSSKPSRCSAFLCAGEEPVVVDAAAMRARQQPRRNSFSGCGTGCGARPDPRAHRALPLFLRRRLAPCGAVPAASARRSRPLQGRRALDARRPLLSGTPNRFESGPSLRRAGCAGNLAVAAGLRVAAGRAAPASARRLSRTRRQAGLIGLAGALRLAARGGVPGCVASPAAAVARRCGGVPVAAAASGLLTGCCPWTVRLRSAAGG